MPTPYQKGVSAAHCQRGADDDPGAEGGGGGCVCDGVATDFVDRCEGVVACGEVVEVVSPNVDDGNGDSFRWCLAGGSFMVSPGIPGNLWVSC